MEFIRKGDLMSVYKRNLKKQYEGDKDSIEKEMKKNAMNIFIFHIKNNPRYRQFLDDEGFDYSDLDNIEWTNIPYFTKDAFRKYNPYIEKEVYNFCVSGGSTSSPIKYASSKESALFIWPCHWLVHNIFNLKPYSKMVMLMGHGLYKKSFKTKIYLWLSNFYSFNSFEMDEKKMMGIYNTIVKNKILMIYGYSSSVNQFLRFLKTKNLKLNLNGIIGTADNMIKDSYELARTYCNCNIYDQYGAHDGDIFGFECEKHSGLHILHDFCTVEIINREIIVTAVKNTAFPFIRYSVGDISDADEIIKDKCECGRTLFRLKGISGRTVHYVKDKSGNEISLIWLSFPLDEDLSIIQYQVYEENEDLFVNFITTENTLEDLDRKFRSFITDKLDRDVKFIINGKLYKLPNGKLPLYINLNKNHGKS